MGSVKVTVYGRVKPCPKNIQSQEFRLKFGENEDIITIVSSKSVPNRKSYRFKKIFNVNTPQQQIFEVVAKPMIQKILEGYNGTIFTYGQTGSGKTYTMTGDLENWVNPGLIPRTIQEIFKTKEKSTIVSISFCEIYNEHVYDLIRINRTESALTQVNLLEDSYGITHFRNLSVHTVSSTYEALELLVRGDTNKMVAETSSNAKSSRSHVIFSISLDLPHPTKENLRLKPVLYLVDLAGSEKLSKCKTPTNNPWETRYINLSLHYLEQVLIALRTPGRAHIPYRNSLMTALLRNSLGGNCFTSMIATFSFSLEDLDETIQTCRFAERIALIKNEVKLTEIVNPQKEIEVLKKENQRLRTQLKLLGVSSVTEGLNEKDKAECIELVENFIENSDSIELPLTDIRRTEYCLWLMKEEIKKSRLNNKFYESNDFDINTFCTPQEINSLQNILSKIEPIKPYIENEKNWRRKRVPVDLPKVNITYKRWKSTDRLSEDVTKTFSHTKNNPQEGEINEYLSKSSEIFEKDATKTKELNSSEQILESDSCVLAGCLSKYENEVFCKSSCASICFEQQLDNIHDDNLNNNNNSTNIQDNNTVNNMKDECTDKIKRPASTTSKMEEEILENFETSENFSDQLHSSEKIKKLVSVGVQIDVSKEKRKNEKLTDSYTKCKHSDKSSTVSDVSSQFSAASLPLTGDQEVDEEILKFYKARYKIFKRQ